MPHVEVKYSKDINLKIDDLFNSIEGIINKVDPSAGVCKSRAFPTQFYKHSHVLLELWLLPKDHRNQAFTESLLTSIEQLLKRQLPKDCYTSVQLYYRDTNYRTVH